jgi:hypothetical protein
LYDLDAAKERLVLVSASLYPWDVAGHGQFLGERGDCAASRLATAGLMRRRA